MPNEFKVKNGLIVDQGGAVITGSLIAPNITGSLLGTSSYALVAQTLLGTVVSASYAQTASYVLNSAPTFIDNFITVGQPGSNTQYNSIKTAVDSIVDASVNNTYTVKVYPGLYLENTITIPSYVAVKGESSISTIVSASNPSASIFIMSDQTMVIDMQIQGSTAPGVSAIYYSSPTTPQTNAIAYAENIRFGTNYTNATCAGSGSGNCILQCSNVKYGGFTDASLKSFDIGFRVTGSGGSIGRMQLRNVTSTNGGVAGTDNNQIFALADAPGCTFIVNGCLLTRATGTARGTGFKVYNGGQLRLTAVNFQRWINGIWAPQTGSAPSIDAIALNFENCTVDTLIEHTGSIGKVSGTDNFLKTQIALDAPLYEVGQDPRKITVGKKGADFTSVSASVAYITDSSENNRYIIEVGPGQYTENTIDLTGKPYVSIVGSNIQTTQIFPSSSTQHIVKMGVNNELSFLSLANAGSGYSAIYVDDIGDFAQVHKISIYDSDRGITVLANTTDTQFYGEYVDINGTFTYGAYVSSSNGASVITNIENYYLFPSASATIGNFVTGLSSSLSLYTAKFLGDNTTNSTAIRLENGAQLEGAAIDIQGWDYGYVIPNTGVGPNFRVVGSMVHDTTTYDFDVQNATTRGRYQGVSNHQKINNVSEDFYWNFLDDEDGENDVTRKLSVTFADGTHTDATTLIFKGSPMGSMQGGTITLSSGLTITTAAGFGYLQDTLDSEVYKRIDWNNTNITLTANTNNYIYLNDAGVLSAAGSAPDSTTNIILGRVVTNNTGVEFIDQTLYDGEHMSNKLSKFNRDALGPVFAEGSIVTEDAVPFKLDVTQGNYYFSENNFLPAGTSSINLNQYYISSSAWARFTSSIVPNNVYASGSQLIPMSSSYYTKHSVYLVGDGVDEKYFLVINNNQYASLVQAEGANLPIIPTYFNDGVVPLASVYVQSGSANITQIEDIRPVIGFRAAGVNASATHGNLLGLTADDHLQYFRVDGTRQMSGNLGLGGNNIFNVSTITAQSFTGSFTGSLQGTASFATNAATAVTASYVLNAVSASFAATAALAPAYVLTSTTASMLSPYVLTSQTSSFVRNSQTSSMTVLSASFAATAALAPNYVLTSVTSSMLAPYVLTSQTSSFVTNSRTGSFATTGSNTFIGNQIITGSLILSSSALIELTVIGNEVISGSSTATLGYTGSLFGTSSWANNAITASYVLNAISLTGIGSTPNASGSSIAGGVLTLQPANENFGGVVTTVSQNFSGRKYFYNSIDVTDSLNTVSIASTGISFTNGSTPGVGTILASNIGGTDTYELPFGSGTFALRVNTVAADIYGDITLTAGDVGAEPALGNPLVSGYVLSSTTGGVRSWIAAGGGGSTFPFTGSAVITGSLVVTGSLRVTAGITGSLFGTSSFALNAISSSYPITVTGSTLRSVIPAGGIGGSTDNSIFLGDGAGGTAGGASNSNFFGNAAGLNATNAFQSNFLGINAGYSATDASYSNFLGPNAGYQAVSASYSTLIGYSVGVNQLGGDLGIKSNNIIIGTNITLPDGTQDSINLGGLIFGTGSYSNIAEETPFPGSANGRIGINQPLPTFNLDVSGSGRYTNGLTVTGSLTTTGNVTVAGTLTAQTLVVQTITSSTDFVTGSTRFGSLLSNTHQFTGSVSITGSLTSPNITGSLFGTSSWANNTISASFASTASFVRLAQTASYVLNAVSSSFATNALTASYVLNNTSTTFTNQSFTATAAQTTFTISGGYTPGLIKVYYNGSKLATSEYTASNGTTVVLGTAAELDDIIDVDIFTTTNVLTAKAFTTITYSGTPNWDYGTGYNKEITLTGNAALSITNDSDGDYGTLFVIQDGVGGRVLTLPVGDNTTGLTAQTTANSIVIYSYVKKGTTRYWNASDR